jgi:hypothetical protein
VRAVTDGLLSRLRSVVTPTAVEQLIARGDGLRAEVAASIQEWVTRLEHQASDGYEDAEFFDRVTELQAGVREWVVGGFDDGVDRWIDRALAQMRLDAAAAPFAARELNSIRVELARRFSAIDDVLTLRQEEFWASLVTALGPHMAQLLEASDPQSALRNLVARLREAPDPCHALAESIEFVLDVRLDFRTRVLPRMRRALGILRPQPPGKVAGRTMLLLTVPHTFDGARDLFVRVSHLARQATHDAGVVLAEAPEIAAQVLLAYAEQFEDAFIRSAASEAEFRRLAEAFGDQMWPTGPALATVRVQHLRSALTELKRALEQAHVLR